MKKKTEPKKLHQFCPNCSKQPGETGYIMIGMLHPQLHSPIQLPLLICPHCGITFMPKADLKVQLENIKNQSRIVKPKGLIVRP